MKINKGEVSEREQKKILRVKFTPNRYPYATKFKNYLELKGVKLNTAQNILQAQKPSISPETFKTFLSGKHIPNSYLTHLIEDVWGIRFSSEDFKEIK